MDKRIRRRDLLRKAMQASAAACGLNMMHPTIRRALAIPPSTITGTIADVQHVVILMQENRSFDHYFGTMSGVRGFGDRILVPQRNSTVWSQSDGHKTILPFHLDTTTTSAMRVASTPHSWEDAQQAWNQGSYGEWPKFKQFESMGYYEADDIPFQRALADAFTICDAHHCSIQSGTLSNRAVFMTGTNFDPRLSRFGEVTSDALIDNSNNRGLTSGPYRWKTYPERLQEAGVTWRIYQDPRENWDGLLAPWEAFEAYQTSNPAGPLRENAMSRWSLDVFAQHVLDETLPQVSWIVPAPVWSEHPAESSPMQGAAFTQKVLASLIANPSLWSRTVLIVTYDENDGFFDHVPPPAPPSLDERGQILGGSTLAESEMAALYYRNNVNGVLATRPYGLGPRVPMYVVSPWSRGGWVCSEVFDHTSTIRFLEKRFGVDEPNISPWHRAISGDLTSCFDFTRPDDLPLPSLPDMSFATGETLIIDNLPPVTLPAVARMPTQDPGVRPSRALPYRLDVRAVPEPGTRKLFLKILNTGTAGAVLHAYDLLHLEFPPSRYTVEAGKSLDATHELDAPDGHYDLHVMGPAGMLWRFSGQGFLLYADQALPEVRVNSDPVRQAINVVAWNLGGSVCELATSPNAYRTDPVLSMTLMPQSPPIEVTWPVSGSALWYDFSVTCPSMPGWLRRFAGRVETGRHGVTDPAMGGHSRRC